MEEITASLNNLTLKRKPKKIHLDPMHELRLLDVLERKMVDAGIEHPKWEPPPLDVDGDFILVLQQWSTEYDRVLRTHNSWRVGKEKIASYCIDEDERRLMVLARWRQETDRGFRFWTKENKAKIFTEPKMAVLWSRWMNWQPPPPKSPNEPKLDTPSYKKGNKQGKGNSRGNKKGKGGGAGK